ncbi:HET and Ankyrin domain-containing protein [Trichoderma harzianum]|uniref:HET and Ankyrin domain-containing protein n=1 Tax=Trichoderma harzianum TaxID=5544 RepID=A0A0F9XCB8_TRIHA|nr:HET and Ankyrin domain-containing protein [Trichoderma harzianum]
MRLLSFNGNRLACTKDLIDEPPPYAILSHTWGGDDDEVTFSDITAGKGPDKPGYRKIQFCARQAASDGLSYFWIDTCCIDKSNSTELQREINSMFRLYKNAAKCYVYLSDVTKHGDNDQLDSSPASSWESSFRKSRWFTRGWTLQELLAPATVEFYSSECVHLGSKDSLEREIHEITQIPIDVLRGRRLSQISIDKRMAWSEKRSTTYPEDKAYSLLGIFGVYIPLIYGEGQDNAFARLRRAINEQDAAGSGKTIMTSKVIEYLESMNDGMLAYYYFSFRNKDSQSLRNMKCAILVQILKGLSVPHPDNESKFFIPRAFRSLYDTHFPSKTPPMEELDSVLIEVIDLSEETFLIVDALDECDSEFVRGEAINFLASLLEKAKSKLHIFITSRLEVDIDTTISQVSIPTNSVALHATDVDRDIRKHLRALLREEDSLKAWSPALKKRVIEHLVENADGVFRWADLQIQGLRGKTREIDVNRALKRLPRDLGETYSRILQRIDLNNYKLEAMAVLRWLSCSTRPLNLAEIAELAVFDVEESDEANLLPSSSEYEVSCVYQNRFTSASEVLNILSGLVTSTQVSDKDSQPHNSIISFSHFSVKEYLQSNQVSPPYFKMILNDCHWFVLKSSFSYMRAYDLAARDEPNLRNCPLLLYACFSVWEHAKEPEVFFAKGNNGESLLASFIATYLQEYGCNLDAPYDILLRATLDFNQPTDIQVKKSTIAIDSDKQLQFSPVSGIVQTVVDQMTSKISVRESGSQRPLSSRTNTENRIAVWKTLQAEPRVQLNAKDRDGKTPLLLAAIHGDEDFFQYLFAQDGIETDIQETHGWDLLTCALLGKNATIIKMILDLGNFDLDHMDLYGRTNFEWSTHLGLHAALASASKMPEVSRQTSDMRQIPFTVVKEIATDGEVWACIFSQDGSRIALCLSSNKALIFDLQNDELQSTLDHEKPVTKASWSPDDSLIVTLSLDVTMEIFDGHYRPWTEVQGLRVQSSAMSRDGKWLVAVTYTKELLIFQVAAAELTTKISLSERPSWVSISDGLGLILMGYVNGGFDIRLLPSGEAIQQHPGISNTDFLLQGSVGGENDTFLLRAEESESLLGNFFDYDEELTKEIDGYISIWDLNSGTLAGLEHGHYPERTNFATWSPVDPYVIASGGDDHKCRM